MIPPIYNKEIIHQLIKDNYIKHDVTNIEKLLEAPDIMPIFFCGDCFYVSVDLNKTYKQIEKQIYLYIRMIVTKYFQPFQPYTRWNWPTICISYWTCWRVRAKWLQHLKSFSNNLTLMFFFVFKFYCKVSQYVFTIIMIFE